MKTWLCVVLICCVSSLSFAWEHSYSKDADGTLNITGYPSEEDNRRCETQFKERTKQNVLYAQSQHNQKWEEYKFTEMVKLERDKATLYANAMRDYLVATEQNNGTSTSVVSVNKSKNDNERNYGKK